MTSLVVSLIVLSFMLGGMVLGMTLRNFLPDHHIRDDSKEAVRTASGIMATLIALIIGLLVSSAKNSFDTASANVTQGGAKVITLDRMLGLYGSEATGVREQLNNVIAVGIQRIWPKDAAGKSDLAGMEKSNAMEIVFDRIRELTPKNDSQQYLKSQALQLAFDLLQSHWMVIEQSQNALPTAFLIVLVFWLAVLFVSFGLLAPRNSTAVTALFICALSMSGAIFLIRELNRPLEGVIKVSSAPMLKAMSVIGK